MIKEFIKWCIENADVAGLILGVVALILGIILGLYPTETKTFLRKAKAKICSTGGIVTLLLIIIVVLLF